MGEVVETTGLWIQHLKEAARDRVGRRDVMWSESSPGDLCVPMEQGNKVCVMLREFFAVLPEISTRIVFRSQQGMLQENHHPTLFRQCRFYISTVHYCNFASWHNWFHNCFRPPSLCCCFCSAIYSKMWVSIFRKFPENIKHFGWENFIYWILF